MRTKYLCLAVLFSILVQHLIGSGQDGNPSDKDSGDLFDHYYRQYKHYQNVYSFDTSLAYADSMVLTAIQTGNDSLYALALRRKGINYKKAGDTDSAIRYLLMSRELSFQLGLHQYMAAAETSIGNIYKTTGSPDSAILYQEDAIAHYTLAGDSLGMAIAYNNLGSVYRSIDDMEEALKHFLRCEELYGRLGEDTRIVYVQMNIGNIYREMGELDRAILLYNKCYEVSKANDNHEMIIVALINLGNAYTEKELLEEAENAYLEAIDLRAAYPNDRSMAIILADLGFVYHDMDKKELAYQYILRSLKIARKIEFIQIEVQCLNYLGIYHQHRGEFALAEKYYREAIVLAERSEYKDHLSDVYLNLSMLLEDKGDLKNSLRFYKLHKTTSDSILNETKVKAITELQARYEKKEDEARILQLQNETAQQELDKQKIRAERNAVFGTGITVAILLIMGLVLFRIKSRKDKIISNQKIQQLEDEKKLLAAQSVMVGQEKERQRLAQELHDSIGVLLSTAKIHFSNVVNNVKNKNALELVKKADKLLSDAGEEVREISHNMMPGVLSKFGLTDAIEDLLDEVNDSGLMDVQYDVEELADRLPENTEIMLYRVVQELVNNTLKHAGASLIKFSLKKSDQTLVIEYTDNGKGFNETEITESKSLGISGVRSRVDFLKGRLVIDSSHGKGMHIIIDIPLQA